MSKQKWLHVIGISGVTTSSIALAYRDAGWKVTGSDKGFWPPISDYLITNNFTIQVGYKSEHLVDENGNNPDLVIYQGVKGEQNPEYQFALANKIKLITYPQAIQDIILKDDASIVIAGTYGKTTITAILCKMFLAGGKNISYILPGLMIDGTKSYKIADEKTEFSIIEGDEYLTSTTDKQSKFFYYKPKFLILNSVKLDHLDLFPTEKAYVENFAKLIKLVPASGLIVANANDKNVVEILAEANCRVIYYSVNREFASIKPDWLLNNESSPLPTFIRDNTRDDLEIIPFSRNIIGDFNEENLLAATIMAYELGVKKERIQEAIEQFTGIVRRLEIKFNKNNRILIDDFGSSPPKARGSIKAIMNDFEDAKLYVVFEPNTGNRTQQSLKLYNHVFDNVHCVILPRFTKLPANEEARLSSVDLANHLKSLHNNVQQIDDDAELMNYIMQQLEDDSAQPKIVIFMGSHGFRGMIKQLANKLNDKYQ